MNRLRSAFLHYFDIAPARIDKKVVTVFISAAVLLVLGEYYDSTQEIKGLLMALFGQQAGDTFERITLFDNDYKLQHLLCWGLNCVLVFLVFPALIIRLLFRENLSDYGFRLKGIRKHLWIYLLMVLIMVPVVFFVSDSEAFRHKYPFYPIRTAAQLPRFFIWEIIYILQFIAIEFFFRGFLLHGLKHRFGYYSILMAVVPYCMIHFGKPVPETLGAIAAGCALGFLSLNTNSILPGILVHVTVALTMDYFALWRLGIF